MSDRTEPPPGYAVWPEDESDRDFDPMWPWSWGALPADEDEPQHHATSQQDALDKAHAHRDRIKAEALREAAAVFKRDDWKAIEEHGDVPAYYLSDVLDRLESLANELDPGDSKGTP
jgi:hypothetical protein